MILKLSTVRIAYRWDEDRRVDEQIAEPAGDRYFNTDHIATFAQRGEHTEIIMVGARSTEDWQDGCYLVAISPDELARLLDPDQCPDPANCSYTGHYLVYGPADLTHGGWHAAERLGQQHFEACSKDWEKGVCLTCTDWERRLRA